MAPFGDGVNISECTSSNVIKKTISSVTEGSVRRLIFRYKDIISCDIFPWILPRRLAYRIHSGRRVAWKHARWNSGRKWHTVLSTQNRPCIVAEFSCWLGGKKHEMSGSQASRQRYQTGYILHVPTCQTARCHNQEHITHITNINTRAPHPHNYRVHYCTHDTSHCTPNLRGIIQFTPSNASRPKKHPP